MYWEVSVIACYLKRYFYTMFLYNNQCETLSCLSLFMLLVSIHLHGMLDLLLYQYLTFCLIVTLTFNCPEVINSFWSLYSLLGCREGKETKFEWKME